MLTLRDLSATSTSGSSPASGPRARGPLGAHLRAARPDAVAVGRRAAAHHRAAARPTPSAARLRRRGWPGTGSPGSGSAPASPTTRCPRRCRGGRRARLPALRGPLRGAVHRGHREGVRAPRQRALRGAAAGDRRARAPRAHRALRARARRRRRRARRADRRPRADLRRPRRGARPPRPPPPLGRRRRSPSLAAELRERVRAGAAPRLRPRAEAELAAARARAAGRAHPGLRRATRRAPQAWLVAVKDAGVARPARPPHPPPGGHGRRPRAAAPPRRRRHRAPPRRRRAGRLCPASWRAPSSRAGSSRSGWASASARSCSRPATRPVRRALRGRARPAALRDEAAGGLAAGTGRCSCALLPVAARGDEALFALAERVRARASTERRRASPPGAGAGRAGGRRCGAPSTRRAARSRRALARSTPTAPAPPPLLATYRDLGSFQLLLSLQDDDALRCSATRSSARSRTARAPTAAS